MADTVDMSWDHVGEDLRSDSPLLQSYRQPTVYRARGRLGACCLMHVSAHWRIHVDRLDEHLQSNRRWNGEVHLSYLQTEHLVHTLEETSDILRSYLVEIDAEKEKDVPSRTRSYRIPSICRKCQRFIMNNVSGSKAIIFTVVLQGLNLLIQTFMDIWAKKDDDVILVVSGITMIFLQVVNLVLIVIKSGQIAKQLLERKVSGIMLAQTYFASILLFSGIYTVTKRIKPDSWKFLREDFAEDPGLIVVLYCKFLYFSVSTATLCGSSDIGPSDWYNYIFVSVQMLLSFMYFASILGQAISPLSQLKHTPPAGPRRAHALSAISVTNSANLTEGYGATDQR